MSFLFLIFSSSPSPETFPSGFLVPLLFDTFPPAFARNRNWRLVTRLCLFSFTSPKIPWFLSPRLRNCLAFIPQNRGKIRRRCRDPPLTQLEKYLSSQRLFQDSKLLLGLFHSQLLHLTICLTIGCFGLFCLDLSATFDSAGSCLVLTKEEKLKTCFLRSPSSPITASHPLTAFCPALSLSLACQIPTTTNGRPSWRIYRL